ncbi:outer membrane protein [Sphingomonas koreensis]
MKRAFLGITIGLLAAGTASAQTDAPTFTGPRVGVSVGMNTGKDKNVLPGPGETGSRKKGVIVRGTVGYDVPISENAIIGAEVGIATGGRDIVTRNGTLSYRTDPGLTLDASGRVGFKPTEQLLLFGKAGWAMQRVTTARTSGSGAVSTTVSTKGTEHGFLWGAGAEYALTPNMALRADFDRVRFNDHYSRTRVMGGVNFRF